MSEFFHNLSLKEIIAFIILENLLIVLLVVIGGNLFLKHVIKVSLEPATGKEYGLLVLNFFLNCLTTVAGYYLWKQQVINITSTTLINFAIDLTVLFFGMDMLMYFLHRLAHLPFLYKWMHSTHHQYENPKPITLFALNPLENLSFGMLWLIFISNYSACWLAIIVYLTYNVFSGLVGHLGVDVFPAFIRNNYLLRYLTTTNFHDDHHKDGKANFGFYTNIWDGIFKTLAQNRRDGK